jgi:hypothetical protein
VPNRTPQEVEADINAALTRFMTVILVGVALVLISVLATMILVLINLGPTRQAADQAKVAADQTKSIGLSNAQALQILKDYTAGPKAQEAQAGQVQVVAQIIHETDCNTRRALAHLSPTPLGQPCQFPPSP